MQIRIRPGNDRDCGDFRVLPEVVLEQMRLDLVVPVGADLEDELPFLARAELALCQNTDPTGPTICAPAASRAETTDCASFTAASRFSVAVDT